MKVLITYFSLSGNTAQVARAIHQEATSQGHEAHLSEIVEIGSAALNAYDLVFLGSACHDSDLAVPAKKLLEEIPSTIMTDPNEWATYVEELRKHPDEGDLLDAKAFASGVLAKI